MRDIRRGVARPKECSVRAAAPGWRGGFPAPIGTSVLLQPGVVAVESPAEPELHQDSCYIRHWREPWGRERRFPHVEHMPESTDVVRSSIVTTPTRATSTSPPQAGQRSSSVSRGTVRECRVVEDRRQHDRPFGAPGPRRRTVGRRRLRSSRAARMRYCSGIGERAATPSFPTMTPSTVHAYASPDRPHQAVSEARPAWRTERNRSISTSRRDDRRLSY